MRVLRAVFVAPVPALKIYNASIHCSVGNSLKLTAGLQDLLHQKVAGRRHRDDGKALGERLLQTGKIGAFS